jgi:uncharacterized protein (TIGR02996 family)
VSTSSPTLEHELLAAIGRAAPDDDEARLVYADWLLERGDPRGELIHVQCALARIGGAKSARSEPLRARERALLAEHQLTWIGVSYDERVTWCFDRGFPTGRLGHTGVYAGYSPAGCHGYARFFPDGTFIATRTSEPSADTLEKIARWFQYDHGNRGTYAITFVPGGSPRVEASASERIRDSWATDLGHEVGEEYVGTETYSGTLTSSMFEFTMSSTYLQVTNPGSYQRMNAAGFDSRPQAWDRPIAP